MEYSFVPQHEDNDRGGVAFPTFQARNLVRITSALATIWQVFLATRRPIPAHFFRPDLQLKLPQGDFLVFDANDGKVVYRHNVGGPIVGGMVNYASAGKQYVAV